MKSSSLSRSRPLVRTRALENLRSRDIWNDVSTGIQSRLIIKVLSKSALLKCSLKMLIR